MPGLTVFGRRWNIASDDLFYPGLFELIFKIVWFVPQVFYYTQYQTDFQCAEVSLLHLYYLGYLCLMGIVIVMHLFIVYYSSQGTITYDEPRRKISKIIYFRSCHVVLELVWSLLGIVWLTTVNWNSCKRLVYIIVLANILFCIFSVILLFIILLIIFDPLSHLPEHDITRKRDILYDRLKKIFFCCYCCLYSSGSQTPNYENSYKQISSILEMIFRGGNLVPSDVLAGIILLSQKEVDQYKRESKIKTLNKLEISKIPKWMNINESCYYVRYAIATYSWPYYIYMNNIKGCGQICCTKSLCCCCCACTSSSAVSISIDDSVDAASSKAIIHGDSNTGRHLKAFKFLSKIDECDLVYANFQNELFLVPFCVLVDHLKKTVVITIRGTLSMRDVITDITAECGYFDVPGEEDLKNQPCHLGMLTTADNIYRKIKLYDLLTETFRKNPTYQLMVTGHSLGAGTAVLLALKLKEEYPNVRCIAYSPPGGLISQALVNYTKSFVMSVIVGDDIVPRLSLRSVHNLKAQILKEIYNCHLPKYKILWKYSISFCGKTDKDLIQGDLNESDEESFESNRNDDEELDHDDEDVLNNSANSQSELLDKSRIVHKDYSTTSDTNKIERSIKASNSSGNVTEITEITKEVKNTQIANKKAINNLKNSSYMDDASYDEDRQNKADFQSKKLLKASVIVYEQVKKIKQTAYQTYPDLQLPGNILYIYQIRSNLNNKSSSCTRRKPCAYICCCLRFFKKSDRRVEYDSRWASQEEFKRILITNRMFMDHFPNNVDDALKYFNFTDPLHYL